MPLVRVLDPGAGPLHFFGAELRRWRTAAGLSQEQLGDRLSYSAALVGKIETGDRAPSLDFAQGCDRALPDAGGLFARLYEFARQWGGGHPPWFSGWLEAERRATSLRWWEPLLIPGLLQTEDYARAILGANPDTDEDIDSHVVARMERQAVLERDKPPALWVALDEFVLHRCVGSPAVMREQLTHLAEMALRSRITVQIVPSRIGVHAGLMGAFIIASFEGASDIVYLETSSGGRTVEQSRVIEQVTLRFDTLRSVALPKDDSRSLILKVAEEQWT
jgi:DNA-binding XRE family transcriptional regulator